MLEGLEAVEINLNDLRNENWTFRIDSEFLKKKYLKNIRKIQNFKSGFIKLYEAISHMTGGATPLGAEYSEAGIPFLRVQNIMQNYFSLNDVVYLTNSQNEEIKRSCLKSRDVLLTITGVSYGKSATVSKKIEGYNINQHSVKITLNNKLNPYFLSTFLNSSFGKLQSDKNIVGVTRPALDYPVIRNFNIPNIQKEFQDKIEELVNRSEILVDQSQQTYSSAEILLLQSIGLQDFKPSTEAVNIKSFKDSFDTSGRLDSEYYQKKYEDVRSQVFEYASKNNYRISFLKEIASNPKYGSSEKLEYLETGIPFLRIADLEDRLFNRKNLKYISEVSALKEASAKVSTNDILISRSGTLGLSVLIQEDLKEAIYGSYFIKITPDIKKIDPIYLTFFLNSKIGQIQVEQENTGGIQTNITIPVIESLYIVIPDKETQKKIVGLVEESFRLKKQSEHLLEVAKKAVEMAIEVGEERGMEWMAEETTAQYAIKK